LPIRESAIVGAIVVKVTVVKATGMIVGVCVWMRSIQTSLVFRCSSPLEQFAQTLMKRLERLMSRLKVELALEMTMMTTTMMIQRDDACLIRLGMMKLLMLFFPFHLVLCD